VEAGGYGSYRDPTASSRILSTNNNAVASASSRLHVRAEAVDSAPTLTKGWRSRHGSVNVLSNRGYISVSKPSRRWKGRRKKISMTEASILLCVIAAGVFAPWVLCRTLNRWLSTDFVSGGPDVALEQITIAALSRAGLRSGDRWPVSVRDEEDNFELIHHPGGAHDLQGRPIELAVPPFYALDDMVVGGKQRQGEAGQLVRKPAFFDGKLISGPVADLIGVYTSEEQRKTGNVDARTIFVSLMSYRDPRCRLTVQNIFAQAAYPERIRVGVIDQIEPGDLSCDTPSLPCESDPMQMLCKYHKHIDVYELESNLSVGEMFARHLAQRMYRGEYYLLQLDSDITFVKDWDKDIIDQHETTGNDMAILTTYLQTIDNFDVDNRKPKYTSRYLICDAGFTGVGKERRLRHDVFDQPESSSHRNAPLLQPFWGAGFSFSRGHFVLSVPYDPRVAMIDRADEEISMAIRAFSHGYDNYAPMRNICFRGQIEDLNEDVEVSPKEKYFSELADQYMRKQKESMTRLLGLVGMEPYEEIEERTEEERYGLGRVREASKFFTCFGIHVESKITERKLCDLVSSGMMHEQFLESLRPDGMGIDYSKIHFRFHELLRVHETI